MSTNAVIDELMSAMREQGIEPSQPLKLDGTLERFHVTGDRKGSINGWAKIHMDSRPAGAFGCMKRYGRHSFVWKAQRETTPMSAHELQAQRADWARRKLEQSTLADKRQADAAVRARALWSAAPAASDAHPYLVRKRVSAHGLRVGPWEFINKETGEVRTLTSNALYVPLCDLTKTVHSLQGIFPDKMLGKGDSARDKDYLKDGAKRGLFHSIGSTQMFDGRPVFILCEGYATGATLHEATHHRVLVTFDTSNLLPVGESIRENHPDAIILYAADNDQWTVTATINNPGVHFAREAANEVDGLVVVPPFAHAEGSQDLEGKWSGPTDFNDLAARDGNAAVAALIEAALVAAQLPPSGKLAKKPHKPEDVDPLSANGHFTILGFDHDDYFFFHHHKRQVVTCTWKEMSKKWMIMMAPAHWWERSFPSDKGINETKALEWIFQTAGSRGIYDPSKIRGRGAWNDKGRTVFHHGAYLTVDGVATRLVDIPSAYVYPMSRELPDPAAVPMTDTEGAHLVSVAELVRWSMPGSAALMAGWVMLAPICGAIGWRPHIWLTGPAGSGKSTVQKMFCAGLTAGINIYAQGNSTEAGIRQELKADALPVLIDEAESNNEREKQRLESVLSLIRQTSSESQAKTLKGTISGTGQHFQIRSMFCMASINVNLPTKADIDRLTKLVIKSSTDAGTDNWTRLESELNAIDRDDSISSRLLARALTLMPVILKSIEVFRKTAAVHFGTQRDGDQFGTLLAGCWCLQKSHVPDESEALSMIERYNWQEHTEDQDQDDSTKALEALLGAKIRMPGTVGDQSVFDLIRESTAAYRLNTVAQDLAEQTLRRHGIIVDPIGSRLMFGTGVSNLKELIARMPAITDLRGQLLRLKGAERIDKTYKFNGHASKVVSIALAPILDDSKASEDGSPI
ncbi:bifunctional DNA primase/helicase [Pseudomonas sp. Q1]|uniref:bifunctional DNA primase/helicase n=1 Tax=Pseudomonas sp. Q1 TaxID=2202823 RepID=UPI001374CEB9|nr:bifunctional DNA primase/helicase [Pseudomonas sp. Q1]NCE85271.1 bifunctional DNA primase/helicase [Pseudomonas sp. Q1]